MRSIHSTSGAEWTHRPLGSHGLQGVEVEIAQKLAQPSTSARHRVDDDDELHARVDSEDAIAGRCAQGVHVAALASRRTTNNNIHAPPGSKTSASASPDGQAQRRRQV